MDKVATFDLSMSCLWGALLSAETIVYIEYF